MQVIAWYIIGIVIYVQVLQVSKNEHYVYITYVRTSNCTLATFTVIWQTVTEGVVVIHIQLCLHTRMFMSAHKHTHIATYTQTCIHTQRYINTHIYAHTQKHTHTCILT